MKHLLLTTIAAVVLVGCGPSVDIHQAARQGNIEAVKQHLADGAEVDAKDDNKLQGPDKRVQRITANVLDRFIQ